MVTIVNLRTNLGIAKPVIPVNGTEGQQLPLRTTGIRNLYTGSTMFIAITYMSRIDNDIYVKC